MPDIPLVIPSVFPAETVMAGFTTRRGGASLPPFDSLNLGALTADDPGAVAENRRRLFSRLGVAEDRVALMGQVHGVRVRIVARGGLYTETDAILTARKGLLLGVLTADCVPVLLHDPRCDIAGAVHCGWRPIAGGILERTVGLMRRRWGCDPGDIFAALGPSAGPCCYEVGPDTASRFSPGSIEERGGSLFADLGAEIHGRLSALGVSAGCIERISRCTICGESLYFSHRRDGDRSGRMMGFVMML